MPTTKISDLLPIPEGVKQPHAYQVFGLEGGEQDAEKVGSAIKRTIRRLKELKADSDPKVWNLAAKLVQQATDILNDAERRRDLDARFGVVHVAIDGNGIGKEAKGPSGTPNADPLSAVLPSADPLAGVLPVSNPMQTITVGVPLPAATLASTTAAATQINPVPPAAPQTSALPASGVPLTAESANQEVIAQSQVSAPAVPKISVASKSSRRRRSSATWILGLFTLGLFLIIGLLGYFIIYGPGELAITSSDGQLTIRTGGAKSDKNTGNDTGSVSKTQNQDSMRIIDPPNNKSGGDSGDGENRRPLLPTDDRSDATTKIDPLATASNFVDPPMNGDSMPMESPPMDPATSTARSDTPKPASPPETDPGESTDMTTPAGSQPDDEPTGNPAAPNSEIMTVDPPTESGQTEMTEEMVAATDAKIEALKEVIRSANWKQMKPAAEQLSQATMTDAQRAQVETLSELADLATYYRGAVERGIYGREPAESISVTESLRVGIVEVQPERLTIRYAGRNKSYSFDELPMILAHRLAEFALPQDKATNLAAKACYQAITPKSTDDYRNEAIDWLISTDGDVAGANPKKIAAMITSLYDGRN